MVDEMPDGRMCGGWSSRGLRGGSSSLRCIRRGSGAKVRNCLDRSSLSQRGPKQMQVQRESGNKGQRTGEQEIRG